MNGFELYIPASTSLKRLEPKNSLLKIPQKGAGENSIKIVAPTQQVLEQAKESLKRNKQEVHQQGLSSPKKVKKTGELTEKKNKNKSQKIHNKYGKKKKKT